MFENKYFTGFFFKIQKTRFLRFLEIACQKTQQTLSEFQKEVYQIASLLCAL